MTAPEPQWQVRADVAWTGEGARFVAMSLAHPERKPLSLEGPAALIWGVLCEEPRDEVGVVARVAEVAGVEAEVVSGDVSAFLAQLEELALVERV